MVSLRPCNSPSLVVAIAAWLVVTTGVGHPTVVAPMDFASQCGAAGRVFVGTVRTVESRRNPSAPRYFETLVTFAVEETIAGPSAPDVTLRFTGGTVGGERQTIDGMPEFTVGERYVVLAEDGAAAPSISPIIGFNQGLYRVIVDAAARGEPRVRDRLGAPLRDSWPASGVGIPDALHAETVAGDVNLQTFLRAIRANRP